MAQPLAEAWRIAAQGDPQRATVLNSGMDLRGGSFGEVGYPRAIMLLTIGRREEARAELRIAALRSLPYSNYDGPHPFQWSAVAILERLVASQK